MAEPKAAPWQKTISCLGSLESRKNFCLVSKKVQTIIRALGAQKLILEWFYAVGLVYDMGKLVSGIGS